MAASDKPPTVKDIARLSQTSASTVSRVLTGIVPVTPKKREAVLQAIKAADYRPNLLARSFKTKTTLSFGLLINDILNPFYGALTRGAEDVASEAGYALMLCNTNEDAHREQQYLAMLRDKSVDGIILAPTGGSREAMQVLIQSGTALVQIDRIQPGCLAASVTVDNALGGYLAAKHLLEAGHERIGFVTYATGQSSVVQREEGCRRAAAEAGLPDGCAAVCRVSFDLADTNAQVTALLETQRPTALIAANNRLALAVLGFLKTRGLRVPDDLAFVVFDDLEIFALLTPSLSAVSQPAYAMGRRAAEFLLAQIASGTDPSEQVEVFVPTLIVRESSPVRRKSWHWWRPG